jgi:hypothetical protein
MGEPPRQWVAATLGLSQAATLVATLENSPGLGEGGRRLAAAIGEALRHDPVLVLVEEGPHIQQLAEVLAEEIFHRAQYTAAGGDVTLALSKPAATRLRLHPASVKAARYAAEEEGASYDPEEIAIEIPAKLARGPAFWQRADIRPEKAREALDLYFALVERDHGKQAAETLRRTAEEILGV